MSDGGYGGLPYGGTPPPPPSSPPTNGVPTALDRPLSDYPLQPDVPEHVKSLMGRMSRGKVYLLEESTGILHAEGGNRIRGDPRIAALVEMLDAQDPTTWLLAASEGAPSPIRPNALFVRSEIIKHLSTAKVFSYATSLGAGVMGIEWLNDTTLHLLFPTPSSALIALSLLSKAGFDPSEGDDPLLERSAHSVPVHLLPMAEPEPVDSLAGAELIPDTSSDGETNVKRKGRGAFAGKSGAGAFDLEPLASDEVGFELAAGVDPNARLGVRYATEGDSELRKEAKQSQWYKRHGRRAGKEVATTPRVSRREDEEAVSWEERGSGEGREFAQRIGREIRTDPYARPRRSGRELDKELDGMRRRGDEGMEVDEEVQGGRRGGGRGRKSRGKEDLDRELDELFASRAEG